IKISPTSTQFINPMDINSNYSEEDNPIALKSDFILSLCELVVGGKEGVASRRENRHRPLCASNLPGVLSGPAARENAAAGGPLQSPLGARRKRGSPCGDGAGNLRQGQPEPVQPPHQRGHRQPLCLLRHPGAGQTAQEDRDAGGTGCRLGPRNYEPLRRKNDQIFYRRVPSLAS